MPEDPQGLVWVQGKVCEVEQLELGRKEALDLIMVMMMILINVNY